MMVHIVADKSTQMATFLLVSLVLLSCHEKSWVRGHGRLIDPPSRATMWRFGFDVPQADYDDNQGYCGGREQLWSRFGGRCGVCGDPWEPRPRAHERGGRYFDGTPVRSYTEGEVINVVMGITANHRGWVEFRLCPYDWPGPEDAEYDDDGDFVEVSHACLDKHLLEMADGSGTRFYLPEPYNVGEFNVDVRLPYGVSCQKCLFQWKWNVANSWGTDPDGSSCIGCGPQEQFYACADIIIQSSDGRAPEFPPFVPETQPPTPRRTVPPPRPTPRRTQRPSHRTRKPRPPVPPPVTFPPWTSGPDEGRGGFPPTSAYPDGGLPNGGYPNTGYPNGGGYPVFTTGAYPGNRGGYPVTEGRDREFYPVTRVPVTAQPPRTSSPTTMRTTRKTTTQRPTTTTTTATTTSTTTATAKPRELPAGKPKADTPKKTPKVDNPDNVVPSFWNWLLMNHPVKQKPESPVVMARPTDAPEDKPSKSWWEKLVLLSDHALWGGGETNPNLNPLAHAATGPVNRTREGANADLQLKIGLKFNTSGTTMMPDQTQSTTTTMTTPISMSTTTTTTPVTTPTTTVTTTTKAEDQSRTKFEVVTAVPWWAQRVKMNGPAFLFHGWELPKNNNTSSESGNSGRKGVVEVGKERSSNIIAYSGLLGPAMPPPRRKQRKRNLQARHKIELRNQITAAASRDPAKQQMPVHPALIGGNSIQSEPMNMHSSQDSRDTLSTNDHGFLAAGQGYPVSPTNQNNVVIPDQKAGVLPFVQNDPRFVNQGGYAEVNPVWDNPGETNFLPVNPNNAFFAQDLICTPIAGWTELPQMWTWCEYNCKRGYCPPSHCMCA